MHILIVEDNRDIADNIADYLESEDHSFDFAMNGVLAVEKVRSDEFDLIILDLMLPGLDGLDVCRTIRAECNRRIPIIMLTARDTLPDKLEGFDAGADDYLTKPFALEELGARIKALAHRNQEQHREVVRVGELVLDPVTRSVQRAGKNIKLNNTCYLVLQILMLASPRIVSKGELELKVWHNEPPGSDVLRSNIYTLRNKIDKPFDAQMLHTEHGVGYSIQEAVE